MIASAWPYVFLGGFPGVFLGILLMAILEANKEDEAWWRGYAQGRSDAVKSMESAS
jgi:hypothetical protein